ncbi:hypothetical protein JCM3770_004588 [Rhodotorula araucariae]
MSNPSAEETTVQLGLISNEQLANQGGALDSTQHAQLQQHLASLFTPAPTDAAVPTDMIQALVSRLDALQVQNEQLQAQLAALRTSPTSTAGSAPSLTIDWNEAVKFFKQATSQDSTNHASKIKVKEPETYDGSRPSSTSTSDVNTFLAQITNYVADTTGWKDDRHRVRVCASYLRGNAYLWVSSYLQLPEETLLKPEYSWVSNFNLFKEKLLVTFGDPNKATADARRLSLLRQTGAAWLYAAEFRRLTLSLNWGDEALKYYFVNGLKEELKDELARLDLIDSLDTLIERVTTLDNRAFMRRLQQRSTRACTPYAPASAPVLLRFTPSTNPAIPAEDRMQIDSTRKLPCRSPLTQEEKDRRRKNNLCSFCGSAGHFVDACYILAARDAQRVEGRCRSPNTGLRDERSGPSRTTPGLFMVLEHLKVKKTSILGIPHKEGQLLLVGMPLDSFIHEIPITNNTKSTAIHESWRGWFNIREAWANHVKAVAGKGYHNDPLRCL